MRNKILGVLKDNVVGGDLRDCDFATEMSIASAKEISQLICTQTTYLLYMYSNLTDGAMQLVLSSLDFTIEEITIAFNEVKKKLEPPEKEE